MSIEFQNISYQYPNSKKGIFDINISIPSGKTTVIIGKTGSGKSTFLKLLDGLFTPSSGKIVTENKIIIQPKTTEKQLINYRKMIGFVFQQPQKQLFAATVLEDVEFALRNFNLPIQKAKETLLALNVAEELWNNSVLDLSIGQKRLVALAGVIAYQPKYLIFDEPTSGLDRENSENIFNFIQDNKNQKTTQIIVTHDLDLFTPIADNIIIFDQGKIIANGNYQDVFYQIINNYDNFPLPTLIKIAKKLGLKTMPKSQDQLIKLMESNE
ncbi:MAG: energy-coupling factor ABC transporter ATP-binding protein [Lactobacillaceae bacterium]|jgi:energy-coupling factor transport system ATP-binding protein|nr:energy-coupling factor ABC transporter ATP-binding protein [Lactobacillaceae bacterium]